MKVLDVKFTKQFIRVCDEGWKKGWHERNGGNLSYRIKNNEVEDVKECFHDGEWKNIGTSVPTLANEYFMVTGSGKFMMNVLSNPEELIMHIDSSEIGRAHV